MRALGLLILAGVCGAMAFAGPIDTATSKAGLTSVSGIVETVKETVQLPATIKQQFKDSMERFAKAMNGNGDASK